MSPATPNANVSSRASGLDASLTLVAELAEAMSGQVGRALREIERATAVSLPASTLQALGANAGSLERECRTLRARVGLEQHVPAPAAPRVPSLDSRAGNRADAARTLALALRALGIGREEVASRLVNTFAVKDCEGIVASVFVDS